ncbi:MAG: ABC transporter ATP-binding protein [Caldilineaceae bacterium]|nr:ABC transporter ATP-binding protein [Caldilineaceae bacterium]
MYCRASHCLSVIFSTIHLTKRAMPTPLLDVRNLYLHYADLQGAVHAVDGLSFTLAEKGHALGIVGESGSGKSSLALAIMRLLPNNVARYAGEIYFNGELISSLSDAQFRRAIRWRKIAMVPQGALNGFNPVVRVGEQIIEPAVVDGAIKRAAARQRAQELLTLVGLPPDIYNRYPHELSGGMKQRAMIAAALIMEPPLVIMDEPTSALDVSVQAQIMNLLKRLKRELGLSLIFITHDIALASDICDSLAVVYAGELVETGSAEQMLTAPQHPYSQKLLASIPRLHDPEMPAFIPGAPPDLHEPPTGCRFHLRCPLVFDRCRAESPPLFAPKVGQFTRCWLLDPVDSRQ